MASEHQRGFAGSFWLSSACCSPHVALCPFILKMSIMLDSELPAQGSESHLN